MKSLLVVLNEKNATIGPADARTARFTPKAATRSCKTASNCNREPTKALTTYSEGKVTHRVSRNRAGIFSVHASHCSPDGPSMRQPGYMPMQKP